jgi:uncharacterized protein YaaQ
MAKCAVNQLVITTATGGQAAELTRALTRDGFHVTQIDSSGGVVLEATVSLLIGLDRDRLSSLLEHIRTHCRTRTRYVPAHLEATLAEVQPLVIEAQVGGATVYVLNVERFEQV